MHAAVSSCRLLSAPSSAGCVALVSSAAQYGIIQYLQRGIITRLQSTRTVSPRTLALLITCHMFGFGLTLIFKTGEETICAASERHERQIQGLRGGKCTVGKQQLCKKRVFIVSMEQELTSSTGLLTDFGRVAGASHQWGNSSCEKRKNVDCNHVKSGDFSRHVHGINH